MFIKTKMGFGRLPRAASNTGWREPTHNVLCCGLQWTFGAQKVDSTVLCAVDKALDKVLVTTVELQSQSRLDTKHKAYLEDACLCGDKECAQCEKQRHLPRSINGTVPAPHYPV
jgi:hypothetical protein